MVADEDAAGGQGVEPGDGVEQRRLARARRTHDGGEAAGGEVDAHAVEGTDGGVALAVDLDGVDGAGRRERSVTGADRERGAGMVAVVDGLGVMPSPCASTGRRIVGPSGGPRAPPQG